MFLCFGVGVKDGDRLALLICSLSKKVADTLKGNIRRQNRISEPLHGNLQITAEQPELIKANLEMDVQNSRFLGAIEQKHWKPPQSQTLERKRHRKWRRKKK